FDAAIELGIGFGKGSSFKIRPAEIEVGNPSIQKIVALTKELYSLWCITCLEGNLTFDQLRVAAGFVQQLRSEIRLFRSTPSIYSIVMIFIPPVSPKSKIRT